MTKNEILKAVVKARMCETRTYFATEHDSVENSYIENNPNGYFIGGPSHKHEPWKTPLPAARAWLKRIDPDIEVAYSIARLKGWV